MSYSRKASAGSSSESNIDWEGFNQHVADVIGKNTSRIARVVSITDLGKQPRPNFKEKYDASKKEHIDAIKDKGAEVLVGEYYANNKKENGEYISIPLKPNDQVSIVLDFPEVLVNYGKYFDDSGEDRFEAYTAPAMGSWWDKTQGEKGMMLAKGIGLSCAPNKKAKSGWGYALNNTISRLALNCVDKDGKPIYEEEVVDQDFDIGLLLGGICTYTLGATISDCPKKYFNLTVKDCAPKHAQITVPDVPCHIYGLSYAGGNAMEDLARIAKFKPILNTLTLGEGYEKSGLKADFTAYFKTLGNSEEGTGSAKPTATAGQESVTDASQFDDAGDDDDMSMFDE